MACLLSKEEARGRFPLAAPSHMTTVPANPGGLSLSDRWLPARGGVCSPRAAGALALCIIVTAYHLLTKQQVYLDLGANYFDERQREQVRHGLTKRLEALGYGVQLEAAV